MLLFVYSEYLIQWMLDMAKASPFAYFTDLFVWHVDWHPTKVMPFDLETWLYAWTWPCMCSQFFFV